MIKEFDLIVIGAGPGGYTAAIRAAQLGMSVACIDSWQDKNGKSALGGTCTNVGCIPSKALLASSELFEKSLYHFSEHGIDIQKPILKLEALIARKNSIIKQNNEGISYLFRKNKVNFFYGHAYLIGQNSSKKWSIGIKGSEKFDLLAKYVLLATGSSARKLQNLSFDENLILSNIGSLDMKVIPKRLGIIGSGVIGLEIGSVWRRLGSEVTVLEASTEFLPTADHQIAKESFKIFKKQGLNIKMGVKVNEIIKGTNSVSVSYLDIKGEISKLEVDKLIISIGRVPYTNGLNADAVGLKLDDNGFIIVDDLCKSNLDNIWAIGDVVRGPMLAHKAEEEAIAVVERIANQLTHVNFNTIPWIIYTTPEISWVGKTEKILKEEGYKYKIGSFPFSANGRARASGDTDGFVKILADNKTDEVLGVHILGPSASELISEAVTIMEFRGASEDIARICHAHPTFSEALKEAALAVDKRAINF